MWYSASLLFKGIRDKRPEASSIWEEIVVLVQAENEIDAHRQSEAIGRSHEHEYLTSEVIPVLLQWSFSQVERVCELDVDKIEPGTEVFSRFLQQSQVDSLLAPFTDGNVN
jgi:hypothetical protein